MDRTSTPVLRITPRPSFVLACFILITHLSAVGVLMLVPAEPLIAILCLGLVVLISLGHAWRTHIRRSGPQALSAVEWDALGRWWLEHADGELRPARLHASSYVQPRLVILNFVLEGGGRRSLVLPPDALEAEQFRRLRVRLRLAGTLDDASRQFPPEPQGRP